MKKRGAVGEKKGEEKETVIDHECSIFTSMIYHNSLILFIGYIIIY